MTNLYSLGETSKKGIKERTGLEADVLSLLTTQEKGFCSKYKNSIDVKKNNEEILFILKNRFLIADYFLKTKKFNLNSLIKGKFVLDEDSFENYLYNRHRGREIDSLEMIYSDVH